jgi:hypothetical protein
LSRTKWFWTGQKKLLRTGQELFGHGSKGSIH